MLFPSTKTCVVKIDNGKTLFTTIWYNLYEIDTIYLSKENERRI